MTKIVEKSPILHNVYLRDFWPKNTISCGGFGLPTKHIVVANFSSETDLIAAK
jgi:hypothetical protein